MKYILFLTCHRVWNVAWISHQNSIQTLYCLHTFCSACAFEIGINLAILHSKSIYSKSNLVTKPSLLSYLKQCHYLSISPWPFMIHLLFMNSNNTFLFQLSELHFCKPIFSSKLVFSWLWLAWQIDIWITISPFCNLLAHTVGILYNKIYL